MSRRRFIAGAVCPQCGEMDRLILESDGSRRRCVACDYSDSLDSASSSEPKTRLDGGLKKSAVESTEVRPVRILGNTKPD